MTYSRPMQPIDAFTQLGRIKSHEVSLRDVLQSVVELAGISIPQVTEASMTLVQGTEAHTLVSTGSLASSLDEAQYELGQGPCLHAAAATTVESVGDMASESRWPQWTSRALQAGARSSLSIGLPAQSPVGGALNLYASTSNAFDTDAVAVARAFAGYAGLAVANDYLNQVQLTLSRHIEAAMDSEAVIEQAKGIIVGDRRCAPGEAFAVLAAMAQDTNRTVRETAQDLVARTAESAPHGEHGA
jgi:GAF domain-containing protein